jgi:hypothetical protein
MYTTLIAPRRLASSEPEITAEVELRWTPLAIVSPVQYFLQLPKETGGGTPWRLEP